MTKYVIGKEYFGEKLDVAPVGTVVMDDFGDYTCVNLPPYDDIEVGKRYPAYALAGLPDGTLVTYGAYTQSQHIKADGRWYGEYAHHLEQKAATPFKVLRVGGEKSLAGRCFTGEQLRKHLVKGLTVEDDDGETAVFDGAEWVGDGYLPDQNPGRMFQVVKPVVDDAE